MHHTCMCTHMYTHTCTHAHRGGNTQTISPGKCFLTVFVVTDEVPLLNRGRLTLLLAIVSDGNNHALVYSSNHWQLSLKALQCLLSISELGWSVLAGPYPRGTHRSTQDCSHAALSMIYDPRHWHLSGTCDRQSQAPPSPCWTGSCLQVFRSPMGHGWVITFSHSSPLCAEIRK